MSNEVWECLRAGGIDGGCPNVMLYRDAGSEVDVEIGVELHRKCPLNGRVVRSSLPSGTVAMTIHRGSYVQLAGAHGSIADWCASNDQRPTGIRWEVYGPHNEDPTLMATEVYWLLS